MPLGGPNSVLSRKSSIINKSYHIGVAAVVLPGCAISIVTVWFGAASPVYLISSGIALVICLLYVSREIHGNTLLSLIGMSLTLFSIATINALQLNSTSEVSPIGEYIRLAGILTILVSMIAAANLPEPIFAKVMALIALVHVPILAIASVSADYDEAGRAYVETLATASLSEVALGMTMAALLSRKVWIFMIVATFSVSVIVGTQMRTAGLALLFALTWIAVFWVLSRARGRSRYFYVTSLIAVVASAYAMYSDLIIRYISVTLLIDDPHRGITTGFSGRFENWTAGLEALMRNPLSGGGFQDAAINYTHNGYLLTLGQFGIPVGGLLLLVFFFAIYSAARRSDAVLTSVLLALALFYVAQPRNINFQLFPLIGLFAVARALARQEPRFRRGNS